MNPLSTIFVGLALLFLRAQPPQPQPDGPNKPPPAPLTWSRDCVGDITGGNENWFGSKQLAQSYVGPGTDGVIYSDWRLATRAEHQAGITAGSTGLWTNGGKWTADSKGSQQSWTASFLLNPDGTAPTNQTVQFAYYNSTLSFLSGTKFVRP